MRTRSLYSLMYLSTSDSQPGVLTLQGGSPAVAGGTWEDCGVAQLIKKIEILTRLRKKETSSHLYPGEIFNWE